MQALTDNTIKDFAAAVRAELADLPKREVQELTDGLEADLHDRLAKREKALTQARLQLMQQNCARPQVLHQNWRNEKSFRQLPLCKALKIGFARLHLEPPF